MARAFLEEVERSRRSAAGGFLLKGGVARVAAPEALSGCCGRGPEVVFSSVAWEGETGLTGEFKCIVDCGIGLSLDVSYQTVRVRCSSVNAV